MSADGHLSLDDSNADGPAPDVLAFPLGRARELLAASGWRVARVLTSQGRRSHDVATTAEQGDSRETEVVPQPSEWEEWRVIRQRARGPGQVELLVAPEMRPRA